MTKKIGLALGGGGAKGLVHISMLEVFDEIGIIPHRIAGTSIGALIGAAYAAGITPKEMRQFISPQSSSKWLEIKSRYPKTVFKWLDLLGTQFGDGALFNVDQLMDELMGLVGCSRFEELKIPLQIICADFWNRSEVVFTKGDLRSAIQASTALPVIFSPVVIDGKVHIDGGAVNPVPYDLLEDCDIRVAINVMGQRAQGEQITPSMSESLFNTFQIMQKSILKEKLSVCPPDILIEPEIVDIQVLDFVKADQIFTQGESAKTELRRKLENVLTSTDTPATLA